MVEIRGKRTKTPGKASALLWHLLPCVLTAGILILLFIVEGFAPFGDYTLAVSDANIQYMDFFCYLKDVLNGQNAISYTFGKTLGGTMIAVLSYYMFSPFSLLVLLFDKTQMQVFFDFVVVGKLTLASLTFSIFLHGRFRDSIDSSWKRLIAALLSVAYALSQYTFVQNKNIMWMDSVYMLPLLLLCVYKVIRGERSWKLAVVTGVGILLNWYSAAMNCIFALVWILLETILRAMDDASDHLSFGRGIRNFVAGILRCVLAMAMGVLLSGFLFLPTIHAMKNSNRGVLDFDELWDFSKIGPITSILRQYVFGATSTEGKVALFAGSLAVIGLLCFFLSLRINFWRKLPVAGLAIFCVMMFYWNPLVVVFSLFKDVGSYWYRYSYLGIFGFLFIAACYFFWRGTEERPILPLISGLLFSAALVGMEYHKTGSLPGSTLATAISAVVSAVLLSLALHLRKKNSSSRRITAFLVIGLLLVVSCGELGLNGLMLFEKADRHSVTEYADYVSQMEDQIAAVKELDTGTYRISETSVRRVKEDGLMANFNEPLCYNYWSITGYTSSPDDIQREFLQRAGYTESGENMCIVMDSVLGTDSLLGVKYVLSKFEINGLQRVEEIPVYNGKYTYENPYALPMALLYERDLGADTEDDTNPFVYQNSLYSELLGREVELYKPVPYVIVQEGDVESGSSLQFALQIPEGNYAIYGNIPWYHYNYTKATIDVNGSYLLAYAQWTSPSVFHIPAQPGSVATIEYSSQTSYDIPMEEVQFYALDLDLLGAVTEEISANVPDASSIQNGRISITVKDAGEGQNLFLSVPADDGWTITDNGENVETELVGECLYSIPLAEGANQIEMRYHIPWLTPGILVSVIGVLCVLLFGKLEKKWENRQ